MSTQTRNPADPRRAEEIMANDMTVEGLRRFCRLHDVTRSHGMNKRETIRTIMNQAPDAAVQWLQAQGYDVVDNFESRIEEEVPEPSADD